MTTTKDVATKLHCEHAWESHVRGGEPLAVRTCRSCRAVDWDDLREQLRTPAMTDDQAERFAALVKSLTEAEMAYRGYISAAAVENPHTEACEFLGESGWQCEGEDGKPNHPDADEYDDIAGIITRALESRLFEELYYPQRWVLPVVTVTGMPEGAIALIPPRLPDETHLDYARRCAKIVGVTP